MKYKVVEILSNGEVVRGAFESYLDALGFFLELTDYYKTKYNSKIVPEFLIVKI